MVFRRCSGEATRLRPMRRLWLKFPTTLRISMTGWHHDQRFIAFDFRLFWAMCARRTTRVVNGFLNTNRNIEKKRTAVRDQIVANSHLTIARKELRISGDALLVSLKLACIKGFPVNFLAFLTLCVSNLCPPQPSSQLTTGGSQVLSISEHTLFFSVTSPQLRPGSRLTLVGFKGTQAF